MSSSVNQAFVHEFGSLVHHLGQQKASRLRPHLTRIKYGPATGFHWERLAASAMTAKASRHAATPINNIVHSKRYASTATWSWGEAIDANDAVQMLISPKGEYVMAASAAYGRRIDTTVLSAAVGNAAVGIGGGGTPVALPGAQIIGTGAALTLALLRDAKKKFDQAEIEGNRILALNAKGLQDLLTVTEVTSSDYNTVKALVQGEIDTFLGFKFVRTETLPVGGAAGRSYCVAFSDTAIGLGLPQDGFARVAEDPSLSFAIRVYLEATLGAVRIEDAGVVAIDILD